MLLAVGRGGGGGVGLSSGAGGRVAACLAG